MTTRVVAVCVLGLAGFIIADEKPKPKPTPKTPKKIQPPVWLAKGEDPKSPSRPFSRGIYSTVEEWLPLFKPTGKLAVELKGAGGRVLRVYAGDTKSQPTVPASLEVMEGEKRVFCARGFRFESATAEDLTGDKLADIFRVTHISGGKPEAFHQFIFEIGTKFRVKTVGPFLNPPKEK